MASVHELAVTLGRRLARGTGHKERAALLGYGLEIILGSAFEIAAILVLGWLFGCLGPVALALAVASTLRLFSGGNHCSAYYRCFVLSLVVFLSLGGAARLLAAALPPLPLFLLGLGSWAAALVVVLVLAPVEGKIRLDRRPGVRRRRRVYSILCVAAWGAAGALGGAEAAMAVSLGLAWQAFSLTGWGRGFIQQVDRLLTPGGGGEGR
ncbi:MAG: accessory gene regulator B family protein [Clostridia bacterium]|nr:accessory gene regulator B family protein [Clostridia bacterium]